MKNWSTGWSVGLPVGCSSCQLLYQGEAVNWFCDAPISVGPVDHRQPAETCVSHIMRPIYE